MSEVMNVGVMNVGQSYILYPESYLQNVILNTVVRDITRGVKQSWLIETPKIIFPLPSRHTFWDTNKQTTQNAAIFPDQKKYQIIKPQRNNYLISERTHISFLFFFVTTRCFSSKCILLLHTLFSGTLQLCKQKLPSCYFHAKLDEGK